MIARIIANFMTKRRESFCSIGKIQQKTAIHGKDGAGSGNRTRAFSLGS